MTKVFVNGTFDILHRGHLQLLEYARSLGDEVVVAIDTDERVREKKGPTRPINTAEERAYMLQSLKTVDHVFKFGSDQELENLIKFYRPDIMVVGSDWKGKSVIGSMYAADLHFFDRLEDYATSKTIQCIIDRG
jgi:D-beta-D-heptose 7-phosphate kinase/D-beta-D-heptose 1-phosphate adenosyltransferase